MHIFFKMIWSVRLTNIHLYYEKNPQLLVYRGKNGLKYCWSSKIYIDINSFQLCWIDNFAVGKWIPCQCCFFWSYCMTVAFWQIVQSKPNTWDKVIFLISQISKTKHWKLSDHGGFYSDGWDLSQYMICFYCTITLYFPTASLISDMML